MTTTTKILVPVERQTDLVLADDPQAPGALLAKIGDTEVPIMTQLFQAQVVQPGHTSSDKSLAKMVGKLYIPELGESFETVHLLPIGVLNRGKRMYAGEFRAGAEHSLACYSVNGLFPSSKVEGPMAAECGHYVRKDNGTEVFEATCPQAKWEGGKKPACADVLNLAFLCLEVGAPIRLTLTGKAISSWNKFMRDMESKRNVARLRKQDISALCAKLTPELEGVYTAYKWEITEATELNPAAYIPLAAYYAQHLVLAWAQSVAARDEAANAKDGGAADSKVIDVEAEDAGDDVQSSGTTASGTAYDF